MNNEPTLQDPQLDPQSEDRIAFTQLRNEALAKGDPGELDHLDEVTADLDLSTLRGTAGKTAVEGSRLVVTVDGSITPLKNIQEQAAAGQSPVGAYDGKGRA